MNIIPHELDVDYVGSQDPADQPTAEDWAAISAFFQSRRAENERLLAEHWQATHSADREAQVPLPLVVAH